MTLQGVVDEVVREVTRARVLHPKFNSAHEGYAVILEEMDELKAEVWKRHHDADLMRKEAVQVAAMAIRFLVDISPNAADKRCACPRENHNDYFPGTTCPVCGGAQG
ncbi:MAG: hypothetical protein ABSC23_03900 [Bryobacteraceae bacterium]|jgi:hypothetical protein